MNTFRTIAPDFAATRSWADRLEQYRDGPWLKGCLESILSEADKAGEAEYSAAAQYAIDSGDLSDLDYLIREELAAEREAERAYAYEIRTGKVWDDRPGAEPVVVGRR